MNSPTDVWGGTFGQVLVHYDGSAWTEVDNPAPYGAAFNALHFWDADHGIAVGGNMGSLYPGQPVVLAFSYGVWQSLPLTLPTGLVNLGLLGVKMVSESEAWAYGAGFHMPSGNLQQPVIVHIYLPQDQGMPASAALSLAEAASAEPPLNTEPSPSAHANPPMITSFTLSATGSTPVRLGCVPFPVAVPNSVAEAKGASALA